MSAVLTSWWWVILLVVVVVLVALWRLRLIANLAKSDIRWPTLDEDLPWDKSTDECLKKVYAYVVGVSDSTIRWYRSRRRPKRHLGFSLRLGALLLTVGAGLVPLAADYSEYIKPVWSTVMIAVAGLFISIDALAGHTSGWVRYMLAQQKVERIRDAFLMEWNALKVAKADAAVMLERAKTYLLTVGKIVDDETQEWAADFQNALKEMERARKAAEVERAGAIEVTVKNPKAVTEWSLEIDGSQRGRTSGKTLAVTDVPVGIRRLKAYGPDPQGKTLSGETTVRVEGGATVAKELELS